MDHRSVENLFAVVAPGLEAVCARELASLGLGPLRTVTGGVEFSGRLAEIYRANLWSRCASRILVRFDRFRCRAFPELYRHAFRLPWGRFLRKGAVVEVKVTCRRSRLMHSGRIAATLEDAIDKAVGLETEPGQGPVQVLLARMVDDELCLSVDSSGELLHRRGYRREVTRAPLRETLAAGVLRLLDWQPGTSLADPMCGTGSFILEAAMLAAGRAPGLGRGYAFQNWPGYRSGLWQHLCTEADRSQVPVYGELTGADRDAAAIAAAAANLASLGIDGNISFVQRSLADQPVHRGPGLVVSNPPYGHRLKPEGSLHQFYRNLGRDLVRSYPGWRCALLCPRDDLVQATGLPFRKVADLDNGGLEVGLYVAGG